ncbi:MAG: hypothetical protein JZU60_03965, partial [Ilumatobacteraceae bacterium]|nr:hypothetical protein [Ilumatobacteraceae bacterium]
MAINTFLTAAGDKLTVASNNQNVFGSTGTQTVLVNSGVTGIAVSNTVERIELAGNMSTYKFVTVTGTGLQIQDSTGAVVGTVASTEGATVAFADGSAALVQTPTSFTIGGTAVAVGVTGAAATVTPTTPLNATDKSTVTGATTTTPTFSVTASSVTEGNVTADNKQLTFTATLSSAAPAGGVTVNYATASGTGTAGAVTASDFVAKTGTLTFAVGETTKTFTVDVVEDTAYEPNETFTVNFNTPVGVTLGTTSVTGTINDDDPNVTPTITKPAAASGYVGVTSTITGLSVADTNDGNLTVTLTAPAGALLTVTATSATVGGATPSVLSATGTSLTGVAAGTVIVSGAKADVNATLATFAYLTNRLDPGTDVVTVKVEDPNGAGATATGVATTTMDVSVGVQKTFTSSTDDFSASGTGGSDLFTGTAANVLAADKVGGAEGTDTVKITAANGDGGSVVATGVIATTAWTSIEVVDVTSYTTAAAANNFFDGDSVTGLTTFNYTDGQTAPTANPDNLTLLDLPTAIAVNLKSDMAAVSIGSKVAASTATINLADGVDIATSLTVAASTVKPATLGITTAGTTGSFITAFAAPGATVNISGTAALTFGTALATGVTIVDTTGALATVDATNLAGALKIDLANHITLALTTKGGSAADTIVGAIAVVNTISGNGGNDTISLSTNAVDGNTLSGNAGDDTITGGTGADTINGGAGKDTLTGGTGADTFVFTVGDSTSVSTTWDSITDLSSGDKINLSGYGINGTNGVALTSNAGAKAANGTKEAYLDTTNQLLVIETSDSGTAVTTESIAIGIAALGALTSNGAGVYTAGPVALVTTNNEAGKLTISGSPIDFANTPVQVNIDNTGTNATLGGNKHANADITDDFLSASVDMNSDANFFTGTSPNGAVDGTDKIGTNAVNDVDANFMAAGGVDIAGNSNANSLTGSQADDKIFGYAGADTILGGAGADLLVGGADADAITGGAGADTIFGGAAKDTITVTESDADV